MKSTLALECMTLMTATCILVLIVPRKLWKCSEVWKRGCTSFGKVCLANARRTLVLSRERALVAQTGRIERGSVKVMYDISGVVIRMTKTVI